MLIVIVDLEGFSFNNELLAKLKVKETEGAVRFMVYNLKFQGYYTGYQKLKTQNMMLLLAATFCLVFQTFIIVQIVGHFKEY